MQVYLTARHLELNDDLRQHVERRIVQPIRDHGFDGRIVRLEIQIIYEAHRASQLGCHVLAQLKGRRQGINIHELAGDATTAVDLVHDRLMPLLTEERDRLLTLQRHPKKYSVHAFLRALGWGRRPAR